ncbi:MAG: hypothetical protein J6T87_10395 [Bacteroidales bacterium]|nr:hypothetical protein [Bacteroidales bacterium]
MKDKLTFFQGIIPQRTKVPADIKHLPFKVCKHFAGDNLLLGYFTYIMYKNAKINWIEEQKRDHDGNEPSREDKEKHVNSLTCKEYTKYVNDAHKFIEEEIGLLVTEQLRAQIKNEILEEDVLVELTQNIGTINKNSFSIFESISINILAGLFVGIVFELINQIQETKFTLLLKFSIATWIILAIVLTIIIIRNYKSKKK